jgi:hypothetical protein
MREEDWRSQATRPATNTIFRYCEKGEVIQEADDCGTSAKKWMTGKV